MVGTILVTAGIVGIIGKTWADYIERKDPPLHLNAKIAKLRLDIKKVDGREFYTYISTFFIPEKHRYISFKVPQKIFDEMVEKDCGILTCHVKRERFVGWQYKP